jgi:hypothetical protein
MKRQRLFCRCAAVVAQVVVDKETHLQLSMTAIDGGEGQLWVKLTLQLCSFEMGALSDRLVCSAPV